MTTTINASLYAADAADESDPTPITLTATGANADAAWDGLRTRIASVLGVESLGDLEPLDDDEDGTKRGTINEHHLEWTITTKKPAKNAIPAERLSTREVAEAIDVAPARLRVYLRSCGDQWTPPGSGGRYSFAKGDVTKIRAGFKKWDAAEKKAKSEKLAAAKTEAPKAE